MADLSLPPTLRRPAWLHSPLTGSAGNDAVQDELLTVMAKQAFRERWKYTKPERVLRLLDTLPQATEKQLPENIRGRFIHADDNTATLQTADFGHAYQHAPEAIAALCGGQPLYLLEVDSTPSEPLQLDAGFGPLIFIRVGANVQLEIQQAAPTTPATLDEYQCVWLSLDDGSQVTHSRNNLYAGNAADPFTVFRHLQVNVPANASYHLHNHSTGCATHRQNIHINCTGPGAHAAISSAALVPAGTHLDQQITVEHSAPHSYSEQTIHNIAGDKANVTFNGRIHIHANSNGVQAHLTNKNLGMGDQATINTKPELEIYTDDVQCSHGATVGQLDADHLFYCASRGIDERSAKQLLSQAFLNVCTQGPLAEEAADWFNQFAGEA